MNLGLNDPGPLILVIVFSCGLLTSLGPCSLSLLPITIAYLAGFDNERANPFSRSLAFCSGIVSALVILGILSGFLGRIYGQTPEAISTLVALLAIFMGMNLLGIFRLPLPPGPDPRIWQTKVPPALAPIAAGFAFGFAASPCTTPVLAVLLAWIAQNGNPLSGFLLLTCFGFGQTIPLLIAGTAAATIPSLLALRPIAKWIPPLSGTLLISTGILTLMANWI